MTLEAAADTGEPRPKMVLSVHGSDLTGIQASGATAIAVWRDFVIRTDALVACSEALGRRAVNILGKGIVPIVVHNGIDAQKFVLLAGERAPTDRPLILSVGKFEEKKGKAVLIKAFASLARDYADLDLVLIGATGATLEGLRQLCIAEGVADRVSFHVDMPHSDVAKWFQRSTLFVLPSRREPFGIVLLEAGCCALPVVASNVGGIPEILKEGVTGRMVAPDDAPALANVMRQILDDPAASRSMGEQLRTSVREKFSWTAAHGKYLRVTSTQS